MTCSELIERYLTKLKAGFHCSVDSEGRLCVVTPYVYPDHDFIELFVRSNGEEIAVSDLGETLRQLDGIGMDVCNTPGIKYAAERIAGGFHVVLENGILAKRGRSDDVGKLMFDVLSAVKLVSSLAYGNRSYEPIGFDDEVLEYASTNGIKLEPKVKVTGQSSTPYTVSFRAGSGASESLIQTISPRNQGGIKHRVDATFRMWSDIEATRHSASRITLLNDEPMQFKQEDISILRRVSHVHTWTERSAFVAELQSAK